MRRCFLQIYSNRPNNFCRLLLECNNYFQGARLPAFGAPPAGGCPQRTAGREAGLSTPRPRGFAAGPGRPVDFQPDMSGHPHGALRAPRRRHGFRFGTAERPCGNPFPHGVAAAITLCLLQRSVAASVKCRKSCSCFCREQSRPSEDIAVAMTRMGNAVIGKKNKTWCAYFMLAATPSGSRRAVRLNSPRAAAVC